MNTVAAIAPFPPTVTSDTYDVNYGRILGAEWMARSAGWYAPETEGETEMYVATVELEETSVVVLVAGATDEIDAGNKAWAWFEQDGTTPISSVARPATKEDEDKLAGLAI